MKKNPLSIEQIVAIAKWALELSDNDYLIPKLKICAAFVLIKLLTLPSYAEDAE